MVWPFMQHKFPNAKICFVIKTQPVWLVAEHVCSEKIKICTVRIMSGFLLLIYEAHYLVWWYINFTLLMHFGRFIKQFPCCRINHIITGIMTCPPRGKRP